MWFLLFVILPFVHTQTNGFSPDTTNYDAYGLKVTANDVLFVEAQGDLETFLVQFAPYNYTAGSLQCSINYDDSAHYVYSVNVGAKQNATPYAYFFFTGEVVPQGYSDTDSSGNNGTFVGVWVNQDPQSAQAYAATQQSLPCDQFQVEQLEFLSSYSHQEFFVLVVEPYGQYAIGLATDFVFVYWPFPNGTITTMNSALVWPGNSTFMPHAADADQLFTIVAGFVKTSAGSRVRGTPTVYLMSNTNLTVLSSWSYTAASNSWQSRLTYTGINSWSSRYAMSVNINSEDPTRVLVGMPFLNTVFLFVITNNGTNLTLASSMDNGNSVGYGTSVTWLSNSQAAVLVSIYSSDYSTWYSSRIYLYTSLNGTSLPASPTAAIPNSQQSLPSTISAQLIQVISTPDTLCILDVFGDVLVIVPALPGFYASTDTSNSSVTAAMPVVSNVAICIAGTFKSDTSVNPCSLCPGGFRNPGGVPVSECMNCSSTSFCPLGAVFEVDPSILISRSQAYAYPSSPELNVFEDILLVNMFTIGSTSHCIRVSPLFWAIIVIAFAFIVLVVMAILKWCVRHPKGNQWRGTIKRVFQQTDLVGEGELWVGGLASIAIIVLAGMACSFSISYIKHYPTEQVGPSSFACDLSLQNAQFSSSLQALAVPVSNEVQPMFDLLNEQNFTLYLDLINTAASCLMLSASQIGASSTTSLPLSSCSNVNGTLSATISLAEQDTIIEWTVDEIQLIGGLRLGLSGPEKENGSYLLKGLDFRQSFYSVSDQTLAQAVTIGLQLTKAINQTQPLSGDESIFVGLWYPTFVYNMNQMFISATTYATSANLTSTTLRIEISETTYYIKNVQSPIAKQPEVIFHTLLFVIICLEISALIFLIVKLVLVPLFNKVVTLCPRLGTIRIHPTKEETPNHDRHLEVEDL